MNIKSEELVVQSESFAALHKEGGRTPRMTSLLIVDDEPGILSFLQKGLRRYFSLVETAKDVLTAEKLRRHCHFDLIITDIRLPGHPSGVEWVRALQQQGGTTGVIFITAHADMETAIAAFRAGAEDFILKPFRMEQMVASVARYLERQKMQRENFLLRRQVDQIYAHSGIVGECQPMRALCEVIKRVAPMPSTVLIEGESGTGKELAARAIHELSGRSGSFVPVNCGAMSAELLESELFGHVKGAFTGAHLSRDGLFAYANGGTLFLDEIGEMPLSMQAHLLRSLEARTIRPVGANRELPIDVRIIAATNRDLGQEVQQSKFREDLYYRLNVLTLRMPALRERREDIPLLAKHFIHTLGLELGVEPLSLGEGEVELLLHYDWPGNVRELKNVIERSLLLNRSPSLCIAAMESDMDGSAPQLEAASLQLEAVQKRHILKVLQLQGGNKSAAARVLGISRKTLERKVQAWGIT
jgi:DNA-binding NtrC family response regulator